MKKKESEKKIAERRQDISSLKTNIEVRGGSNYLESNECVFCFSFSSRASNLRRKCGIRRPSIRYARLARSRSGATDEKKGHEDNFSPFLRDEGKTHGGNKAVPQRTRGK